MYLPFMTTEAMASVNQENSGEMFKKADNGIFKGPRKTQTDQMASCINKKRG